MPATLREGRKNPGRVLILGEDAPGALMHSYAAAFRRLGAEVETYCLVRAYAARLGVTLTRVARRFLPAAMIRRVNARVLRDVSGRMASLILVIKGDRLQAETVHALRERSGAQLLNYYPDDPFAEDPSMGLVAGVESLAAYDRCFTFARHLIATYRAQGVPRVEWLPFARDPDQHGPLETSATPEFDAVFVGNLDAERVRWLEPVARRCRLAVFGEYTRQAVPSRSAVARAHFLPAAYGRDLAYALARGRVSLNVMRVQNQGSHNMRSFESLACGAFTITQRTPELVEMFRDGEEVIMASHPEEMAALVDHWLDRPVERATIADRGFRRVEHDTYETRARVMSASPVPSSSVA